MANTKPKVKTRNPLKVKLLNAAGQVIEGLIPSGQFANEDPALAIAQELSKHKHLEPTPLP
jgi:hypothetical protein